MIEKIHFYLLTCPPLSAHLPLLWIEADFIERIVGHPVLLLYEIHILVVEINTSDIRKEVVT